MTERPPEVEIAAGVSADEVRFECRPRVEVVAYSNVPASVEHDSQRDNLPDQVEEGVPYRNVSARWRVALRLRDPAS